MFHLELIKKIELNEAQKKVFSSLDHSMQNNTNKEEISQMQICIYRANIFINLVQKDRTIENLTLIINLSDSRAEAFSDVVDCKKNTANLKMISELENFQVDTYIELKNHEKELTESHNIVENLIEGKKNQISLTNKKLDDISKLKAYHMEAFDSLSGRNFDDLSNIVQLNEGTTKVFNSLASEEKTANNLTLIVELSQPKIHACTFLLDVDKITITILKKISNSEYSNLNLFKSLPIRKERTLDNLKYILEINSNMVENCSLIHTINRTMDGIRQIVDLGRLKELHRDTFKYLFIPNERTLDNLKYIRSLSDYQLEAFNSLAHNVRNIYILKEIAKIPQLEKYHLEAFNSLPRDQRKFSTLEFMCKLDSQLVRAFNSLDTKYKTITILQNIPIYQDYHVQAFQSLYPATEQTLSNLKYIENLKDYQVQAFNSFCRMHDKTFDNLAFIQMLEASQAEEFDSLDPDKKTATNLIKILGLGMGEDKIKASNYLPSEQRKVSTLKLMLKLESWQVSAFNSLRYKEEQSATNLIDILKLNRGQALAFNSLVDDNKTITNLRLILDSKHIDAFNSLVIDFKTINHLKDIEDLAQKSPAQHELAKKHYKSQGLDKLPLANAVAQSRSRPELAKNNDLASRILSSRSSNSR